MTENISWLENIILLLRKHNRVESKEDKLSIEMDLIFFLPKSGLTLREGFENKKSILKWSGDHLGGGGSKKMTWRTTLLLCFSTKKIKKSYSIPKMFI